MTIRLLAKLRKAKRAAVMGKLVALAVDKMIIAALQELINGAVNRIQNADRVLDNVKERKNVMIKKLHATRVDKRAVVQDQVAACAAKRKRLAVILVLLSGAVLLMENAERKKVIVDLILRPLHLLTNVMMDQQNVKRERKLAAVLERAVLAANVDINAALLAMINGVVNLVEYVAQLMANVELMAQSVQIIKLNVTQTKIKHAAVRMQDVQEDHVLVAIQETLAALKERQSGAAEMEKPAELKKTSVTKETLARITQQNAMQIQEKSAVVEINQKNVRAVRRENPVAVKEPKIGVAKMVLNVERKNVKANAAITKLNVIQELMPLAAVRIQRSAIAVKLVQLVAKKVLIVGAARKALLVERRKMNALIQQNALIIRLSALLIIMKHAAVGEVKNVAAVKQMKYAVVKVAIIGVAKRKRFVE